MTTPAKRKRQKAVIPVVEQAFKRWFNSGESSYARTYARYDAAYLAFMAGYRAGKDGR